MNYGCPTCPDASVLGDTVYDTGMLIALGNGAPHARLRHDMYRSSGLPAVPAPVVAQAWRGGAKTALLARALNECAVISCYTVQEWRRVGECIARAALAPKKRPDVVDGLVALTAASIDAAIVATSDPDDIAAYLAVIGVSDRVEAQSI